MDRKHRPAAPPHARRHLTTSEAASYCGFASPATIRKAIATGKLTPAGRRGGTGTWVIAYDELDRFLVGVMLLRNVIIHEENNGQNVVNVVGPLQALARESGPLEATAKEARETLRRVLESLE